MKKKIMGIFVFILLISAPVLAVSGIINRIKTTNDKELELQSIQQHEYKTDSDWDYWSNPPHIYEIPSGNVGIGTANPSAKLDVKVHSGGAATFGSLHTVALGNYAIAMGFGTNASGNCSTAFGKYTTASGLTSTAMGWGTTASGSCSTAMGEDTTASGSFSTAMGRRITVDGDYVIIAKAVDENGLTGAEGKLPISMPRGIISINTLILRLLERVPYAFPLLRHLLGL